MRAEACCAFPQPSSLLPSHHLRLARRAFLACCCWLVLLVPVAASELRLHHQIEEPTLPTAAASSPPTPRSEVPAQSHTETEVSIITDNPAMTAGQQWSDDVDCGGLKAKDRAEWCMQNAGLSLEAARQRVMGEFPGQFTVQAAPSTSPGLVWDGSANCDGSTAQDRVHWCMQNLGLSETQARQRVMGEYPQQFQRASAECTAPSSGSTPAWNGNAMCEGSTAEDRAQWCMKNLGMSESAARQRVMGEYPAQFAHQDCQTTSAAPSSTPMWDGHAMCDGSTAEDRARWCMQNLGLSESAARQRVMGEYPACFKSGSPGQTPAPAPMVVQQQAHSEGHHHHHRGFFSAIGSWWERLTGKEQEGVKVGAEEGPKWNGSTVCDGSTAQDRAKWLQDNKGMSQQEAQQQVMREYPHLFGGSATGLSVSALGAASKAALQLTKVPQADPRKLVWSDEFDYEGPPDPKKWTYDKGGHGWGNHELQHYTDRPHNAFVSKGALRIHARRENFEGQEFTSARLVTKGLQDWKYGRVEVRLKLPTARGSWAAAWMLPTESAFGDWPKSGEIDIMEHVGYDCGNVHGTVHTEKFNHMKNTQVGRVIPVNVGEFHIYAIDWTPDRVSFMCDDQKYHEFRKESPASWEAWPFDNPFHVILNIAVGGDWGGQKGVDHAQFEGDGQVMEVSWVRVYKNH
mmetsp:Transcript_9979/g.21946  ORF Transcript_9979/g.21946 Transcript_9979/m.21946 type:complete len:684 (-) Transcript_9979:59-2110(-)